MIPFPDENIQKSVIDFLSEIEGKDNVNPDFIFPEIYSQINQLFSHRQSYSGFQTELKTQSNLLSKLRQSYLQEAVMGKLTEPSRDNAQTLLKAIKSQKAELIKQGKLRKEKPLAPIKPEEIPFEIPDNWVWCRLGEVCELIGGYAFKSDTYVNSSDFQIIRLGNVKSDQLVLNTSPTFIPENIAKNVDNFRIKENDILITMTGTKGRRDYYYTLLVENLEYQVFVNQRVGIIRNKVESLSEKYINILLKENLILDFIFNEETGSANQGNVGSEVILNCPIPLPPLSEQKAIVAKVEGLLENVSLLESENKAQQIDVQRLMGAVLQEAFGGR